LGIQLDQISDQQMLQAELTHVRILCTFLQLWNPHRRPCAFFVSQLLQTDAKLESIFFCWSKCFLLQ